MIDEESIKQNLNHFAFPRLSGTIHEKKALDLAFKKVSDLGLKPNIQNFEFSTFYSRTYPKIAFLFGFLLLISFYIDLSVGIFISLIIGPILVFLVIIMRKPENVKFPRNFESANLFVKLKVRRKLSKKVSYNQRKRIVFSCHLDSKGQKLSILARIRSMRTWIISSVIIIGTLGFKYLVQPNFVIFFIIIGGILMILNFISTILILINTTNNSSLGAIDNATGITCVLELLKYYLLDDNRIDNIEYWFVFTGCEETGTMGIRNLYKKIKFFERDSLMLVNFDAIGGSITIFDSIFQPEGYREFYNSFLNNNIGLEIREESKRINFGTHSDGYYLKKKNFQGIEFGDMEAYQFLHSKEDTIDKVNTRNLKKLCEVIVENLRLHYKNM